MQIFSGFKCKFVPIIAASSYNDYTMMLYQIITEDIISTDSSFNSFVPRDVIPSRPDPRRREKIKLKFLTSLW